MLIKLFVNSSQYHACLHGCLCNWDENVRLSEIQLKICIKAIVDYKLIATKRLNMRIQNSFTIKHSNNISHF